MARRLAWTETAWRDLERVGDYIAEDSPGYAAAFVRRVRDRARSLDELAERGRVVPELDDPAVRELVVGSYRLIYEIAEEAVYVLGLVHGARDLSALWDDGARRESSDG
ncbi:MAG: type II toxin-antitoxin system RelE/ParE family toxin [Solirubrobacterales bacterium]